MRRFLDAMSDRFTPMFDGDDGTGGGGGGSGDGDGSDDKSKATVTMTQADLDALIAREKARAKKPFADYDDIKAKIVEFEKAEEERKKAAMTEKERLEAEKAEALKKAEEAEALRNETLTKANQRLVNAEFRSMARTAEFNVRSDALDDALKLADLSAARVDDEGSVTGVKEALEALIKAKPYLVEPKKQPRQIGEGSNHDDKGSQKTAEQLLTEAADKARKSGRTEDIAAYAKLERELKSN